MTGGGFGGSVIALVAADRAATVTDTVSEQFVARNWPGPQITAVTPSQGAARLR
jgi:galactokinase